MNSLTKRTQEEILQRINEVEKQDWMGTQRGDLIAYLDFEHAKPFLKEGITESEWNTSEKTPAEEIKEYMSFAWDKANNFRGLSAGRSLEHMISWLWLDSQNEFLTNNDILSYEFYGKDQLVKICELYSIDSKQWDDGVRANEEPYE